MTDSDARSIRSWVIALFVVCCVIAAATLFQATRETEGIKARALVDAHENRIHDLEIQSDWLRKALWQNKFPDVDDETLDKLMEVTHARR